MKILRIRFKNLNSLVGEWDIDFSHHAFSSHGIFVITGPTGAGKTTILDALCLALYGRTPRLTRITENSNEIMSRQSGECFAEVSFETQAGQFCCHWSQGRARKKPQGKLQAPRHEIIHVESGAVLASTIRSVAKQVETVTGMDFDRFTRSMLLAQGGFAAFLQADPDERAPILEQITGTEMYSHISVRVHERLRTEQNRLRLCQEESAGIMLLSAEQEQEIAQNLATQQKHAAERAAYIDNTRQAIAWLTTIQGLRQELSSLDAEMRSAHTRQTAFAADRVRLVLANKAAALEGLYAELITRRTQQVADQRDVAAVRATLPELERVCTDQATSIARAEESTCQAKARQAEAVPLLRTVRALDLTLAEKKKTLTERRSANAQLAKKITELDTAQRTVRTKITTATARHAAVQKYRAAHASDAWLEANLTAIESQLSSLATVQQAIATAKSRLKTVQQDEVAARNALMHCQKHCATQTQNLQHATQNLRRVTDELHALLAGQLLREYRARKESLLREMALLTQIAELEDHRARLENGKPCPLCGATEHPFAQGNVPLPNALEQQIATLTTLIEKAEHCESKKENCIALERAAQNALAECEKQEVHARHQAQNAEQICRTLHQELQQFAGQYTELKQTIADQLLPLGITAIADADFQGLGLELRKRLATWQDQARRLTEIERELHALDSEQGQLLVRVDEIRATLKTQQAQLEALEKEYYAEAMQRQDIYAGKNPDTEEMALQQAVFMAEEAEKKARAAHQQHQNRLHQAQTHATALQQRIEQNAPQLQILEKTFAESLAANEFADEHALRTARMSESERSDLAATAKKLDDQQTELRVKHTDRATRLATELDKKCTPHSRDELMLVQAEHEKELQRIQEDSTALTLKLRENTAAKDRAQAKQAALEAQQAEYRRWDQLHALIGSADGKKFRNFVQGLTFERMVRQANRQLQKMTDRYLLVRNETQPLELSVLDLYQAGEIRSTKNLSGGESFLVSLALALGLSHMASKNVRVDSLFLDEGFGTLDEEALETALETLASLRADGKIIGVISHIQALKDRISTQIEVLPRTGGRSRIAGPGCSAVQ